MRSWLVACVRRVPWLQRMTFHGVILYQHVNGWWRYGDWNLFRTVSIEISQHCNRSCPYCPNALYPRPKRFMADALYKRIVERLQEMQWNGVVDFIFYNEPLLDPRVPQLVRQLKASVPNCIPRIVSNGDLLTEALFRELIDAGVERFWISRHQPVPDGWDARMRSFQEEHPGLLAVTDLLEVQEKQGLHTRAGLVKVDKEFKAPICTTPESAQHIDIEGNLLLCCNDYHRAHPMGNIKTGSILDIWNGINYSTLRSELRSGRACLDICKQCLLQ